jgi:hypothetical protein
MMKLCSRWLLGRAALTLATALGIASPRLAQAQTWVDARQGPALREILTIDATGEDTWLWGAEDVANNGDAFPNAEQAIDARTVYAATDSARFYARVYFSITGADPGEVTTYVFLDTDRSVATGGHATGSELDANLTDDPTEGGYEYVIRVQRANDGTTSGAIFQFSNTSRQFVLASAQPTQLSTEAGVFLDPLRVNQNAHGYIQSAVDLNLLSLGQTCATAVFVRTTNQGQNFGPGDLVVGRKADCTPTFTNGNPDVIINPPERCTRNEQCPNAGICVNGDCRLTAACIDEANCNSDQQCLDGRCVYRGGTGCTNDNQCDGLVCDQGQCVVCINDNACGAGRVCGPDGRCTTASTGTATQTSTSTSTSATSDAGIALLPGERIQGGACACRTIGHRSSHWFGVVGLLGLAAALARGIKRERNR